jgi:hypothetical protein
MADEQHDIAVPFVIDAVVVLIAVVGTAVDYTISRQ